MKDHKELYSVAVSLNSRLAVDRVQKLDKTAGRLYIYPTEFRTEPCVEGKPVVKIVAPVIDADISLFQNLKSSHKVELISLTALANTQMALFGHGEDISFIDMQSICKADFFMEYFWNLAYNVMDSIKSGKNCEIWGQRLGRYLQGITQLYQNRDLIGDGILYYRDRIRKGLEKRNVRWRDFDIVNEGINRLVQQKKQTQSFDDFIFSSQDDKDMYMNCFKTILLTLKGYLMSYMDGVSSRETFVIKLKEQLDAFILDCEVNLLYTDPLKEISPNSRKNYKANAGLIIRYLRKVRNNCNIKEYEAA